MKRKRGRSSQKAAETENGIVPQQNGNAEDEVLKESPKKNRKSGGAKAKKSKKSNEQVETEVSGSVCVTGGALLKPQKFRLCLFIFSF